MLGGLGGRSLGLDGLIDRGLGHDIRLEGDLDRDLGDDLVGGGLLSGVLGHGLDRGGLIDGLDGRDLDDLGDLVGHGRLLGGADGLADGLLCDGVDVGGGGLVHGDGRDALLVSHWPWRPSPRRPACSRPASLRSMWWSPSGRSPAGT